MSAPSPWHPTREEALPATLDQLKNHWVRIQCDCGQLVYLPGKMLLKQCGSIPLSDVIPRLRCKRCGLRPTQLRLTDDPTGGVDGKVAWSIALT